MKLTEADKSLATLWPWEPECGDHVEWNGIATIVMAVKAEHITGPKGLHVALVHDGTNIWRHHSTCIPLRTSDQIFAKLKERGYEIDICDAHGSLGVSCFPGGNSEGAVFAAKSTFREALAAALVKVLA